MRVISGTHKSRRLLAPQGSSVRPTADKVKEALFNIIGTGIDGARVLDAFCGSGGLGIESLSRGASGATFVDKNRKNILLVKQNLQLLNLSGEVIFSDTERFLLKTSSKYDFIFIDPPYSGDLGLKSLKIIGERQLLNAGGQAIFETDSPEPPDIKNLNLKGKKRYGRVFLYFYEVLN